MQFFNKLKSQYKRTKDFYLANERLLMPGALLVGFLIDYFTFTSIEIKTSLLVLLIYWFVVGLIIVFIQAYDRGSVNQKFRYIRLFAPLLIQFFFGALLGGSFVFYWFSGTFSVSWPFILVLVMLMVSNEVFRKYFAKPTLQLGFYFFITFALFAVVLPFAFNSLSAWLFVWAGVISLVFIIKFFYILTRINKELINRIKPVAFAVVGILAGMNLLYFLNIIPPIPLALRESGVYYDVSRMNGEYVLTGEPENLIQRIIPGQTLYFTPGERIYVFTSVFAPADLSAPIWHYWEYYDEVNGEWVKKDRISYPITGGRKEGYRGYTWKSTLEEGKWRVFVKTTRGQVLGQIKFNLEVDIN